MKEMWAISKCFSHFLLNKIWKALMCISIYILLWVIKAASHTSLTHQQIEHCTHKAAVEHLMILHVCHSFSFRFILLDQTFQNLNVLLSKPFPFTSECMFKGGPEGYRSSVSV